MDYSVYVLLSLQNASIYIGITGRDPRERLKEHNSGEGKYTKLHKPYKLIYYELGYCKACALKREAFLKSGQGRKVIHAIISCSDKVVR